MLTNIPSLAALESNEERPLAVELRLLGVRSQAAVVRALADEVERISRVEDAEGLGLQIIEEMARLGHHLLDAAGELRGAQATEDSGVFTKVVSGRSVGAGS